MRERYLLPGQYGNVTGFVGCQCLAATQGSVKSLVATQGNVTAAFSHQIQKVKEIFPWRRDLEKLPWRGPEGSQPNSCHSLGRALAAGEAWGKSLLHLQQPLSAGCCCLSPLLNQKLVLLSVRVRDQELTSQ